MKINIENAKEGMILSESLYNYNGVVILNKDAVLTEKTIHALRKNGFFQINVKDIYTTISEELKHKSMKSLKELNFTEIINNANKIVKAILNSKDFSYSLLEYKQESDIYSHSVRVAAFASVLAKYYNKSLTFTDQKEYEKNHVNMESLSTAALVHDLGETLENSHNQISLGNVSAVFKEKLPGINDVPLIGFDERFIPLYTFAILTKFPKITADVKMITLLTGENENSTGPLKAQPELTHSKQGFVTAAKIIKLCSIYDDLLRKAVKNNQPLENVVSQLEAYAVTGELNKELTELFINHVPLYSVGIKVKLSDGRNAIVVETFTERVNNYKPKVQIEGTDEIIDLRGETALTVREICDDEMTYAELATRQIIDMNNEITTIEQKEGRKR